jgi:cell division protein FtsI/penicillin-binding protein 2
MSKEQETYQRVLRVTLLVCTFVAISLGAGFYRVISLKVDTPEKLISVATRTNSTIIQLATRGSLIDRRGRILAGSRVGYKLFVDPSLVKDVEQLAFELGEQLKIPPAYIERKIRARAGSCYVVIIDLLEHWQVDLMRASTRECVGLKERLVRSYPHGESVASLVGLVGTEHTGLAGLEHTLNEALYGESGKLIKLRDIKNKRSGSILKTINKK